VPSSSSETGAERLTRLPGGVALHARPAGLFVRTAATFRADVVVSANGRDANAKSILEILALGAEGGAEIRISASGDDAAAAVDRLAGLVLELQ
jgi:phosphotransferase system HPr (HPr) family protein